MRAFIDRIKVSQRPLFGLFVCFLGGCASAPDLTDRVEHLLFPTLKIRRPLGLAADPKVGPGGEDYHSEPLPNERWDCDAPGNLFQDIDLRAVRECWSQSQGAKSSTTVTYRLRLQAQPIFELLDPEDAPPCLVQTLSVLPVPREIFFQSIERGDLECFSTRLNVEKNQYLGFQIPLSRMNLEVQWPPASVPRDDDELRKVLVGWVLSPFWLEDQSMRVHYVPEHLCRRCLGAAWKEEIGPDVSSELWPN